MVYQALDDNNPIHIDEFSTGITPEGTVDNWVSKGFTGRYMNSTLTDIPKVVLRAINNYAFAVAEGSATERPAIIGRVISGSTNPEMPEEDWSVIALISRGRDEFSRSFGFHRYFLSPGKDNLWKLAEWLEAYEKKQGHYPIFNPFKTRSPGGQRYTFTNSAQQPFSASHLLQEPWMQNTPTIVPFPLDLRPLQIQHLAEQKAQMTGQPVSWALNVEALEKPERFLLIKPGSDKSERLLSQIGRTPTSAQTLAATVTDERGNKNTLQGLSSGRVTQELVSEWATALSSVWQDLSNDASQVSKYWEDLFNKLGANEAISSGIYSPSMVKLLTLRTVTLPHTLPQYLDWLNISEKQSDASQVALDFQAQLRPSVNAGANQPAYKRLIQSLREGVKQTFLQIFDGNTSLEIALWVLGEPRSLWSLETSWLVNAIHNDLLITIGADAQSSPQTAQSYKLQEREWQIFWSRVRDYKRIRKSDKQNDPFYQHYIPIGKLLADLGYGPLAACFYQIGQGLVPPDLYDAAQQTHQLYPMGTTRGMHKMGKIYGMVVYRDRTSVEKAFIVSFFLARVALLVAGILGILLLIKLLIPIIFSFLDSSDNTRSDTTSVTDSSNSNLSSLPTYPESINLSEDGLNEARNRFEETTTEIRRLIDELSTSDDEKDSTIRALLRLILSTNMYPSSKEKVLEYLMNGSTEADVDPDIKDSLVMAIIQYQNDKKMAAKPSGGDFPINGFIEENSRTYDALKADLEAELKPIEDGFLPGNKLPN